jgi:biopolymer transport protein ExbB/TolQ
VFEPLVITDMVLALLATVAGIVAGRMASGVTGGLRRWLSIMGPWWRHVWSSLS